MADEQNVVKRIAWNDVFSFPHIFKGFKMAIYPSMLVLGVIALVLVFAGGHVLDTVWSVGGGRAMDREILAYAMNNPEQFEQTKEAWEDGRLEAAVRLHAEATMEQRNLTSWKQAFGNRSSHAISAFNTALQEHNAKSVFEMPDIQTMLDNARQDDDSPGEHLSEAEEQFEEEIQVIEDLLDDAQEQAEKAVENNANLSDDQKEDALEDIEEAFEIDAARAMTQRRMAFARKMRQIEGVGLFESFVAYQQDCLYNAIRSVRHLNFSGGLAGYQDMVEGRRAAPASIVETGGLPDVAPDDDQPGALFYALMAVEGYRWMLHEHPVYFLILGVWSLGVLSLFGGGMYRIAALHFARQEKISMFQALRFSRQKFLSFLGAPLVLVAVILFTGLLLALGGLLGSIPLAGDILLAVLFGIAILLGVGIAFMAIGLVAGGPLMYPTIAVEGSDAFDAISRSVSYVYGNPFRAAFYGVVASVYGVITYLFVRLFAYIALLSAHTFVKWGVLTGGQRLGENADKLDVLWHRPTFWDLHTFNWYALSGWQSIWAIVLAVWVYLVIAVVAAYLLTFFASSTTTIYFLLRRREDATDLDEVYVEEDEELDMPATDAEEASATTEADTAGSDATQDDSGDSSDTDDTSGGETTT